MLNHNNINQFKINLNNQEERDLLFSYLKDYLDSNKNTKILNGQSIQYGVWILKLFISDSSIDVKEADPSNPKEFRDGFSFAFNLMKDQIALCELNNIAYTPAQGDELCAIFPDVITKDNIVYGLRWSKEKNMSGFLFWTDNSPQDMSKVSIYHIYDLPKIKPELLRFLGIPVGYRFNVNTGVLTKDDTLL